MDAEWQGQPRPSSESKCLSWWWAMTWNYIYYLTGSSELVPNNTYPKPPEDDYSNHASWCSRASWLPFPATCSLLLQTKTTEQGQHCSHSMMSNGRRIETTGQTGQKNSHLAVPSGNDASVRHILQGLSIAQQSQLPELLKHAIPGDLFRIWAINTLHSG